MRGGRRSTVILVAPSRRTEIMHDDRPSVVDARWPARLCSAGRRSAEVPFLPSPLSDAQQSRLILAILRGVWSEAEEVAADGLPEADAFVSRCLVCEVPSWIHHCVEQADRWSLLGEETREKLGRLRRRIRNDNLLLLARLEQALDLLAAHGVTPLALKGADTLGRFYAGFDQRMLVDVDLLVRPEELQAALAALEEGGWESPPEPERTHWIRGSHHLPLEGPGPVPVDFELHWNLVQEGRYTLRVEDLFDRAVPTEVAGRKVLRLEDHDFAAHLLVHHFSHYFGPGLKNLIDLRFLAREPNFSWDEVVARVRDWGGSAAAAASLEHMKKLWPELIPDHVVRMLRLAPWRRALTWPLRSSHPLELYRNTRNRRVQLYLAGVMLERPASLPAWVLHRSSRDQQPGKNPLDRNLGE